MSQAYESTSDPSTDAVPPNQWRIVVALLLFVIVGGMALALALALGAADPPRAGKLAWETSSLDGWMLVKDLGGSPRLWLHRAPVENRAPPFTLEVEADLINGDASAWGLWIETRQGEYLLLAGYGEYISTGISLDWRNFLHVRPDTNHLYLHVEPNGVTTFRVNREIAWSGQLDLAVLPSWGIAMFSDARFDLHSARLYAP